MLPNFYEFFDFGAKQRMERLRIHRQDDYERRYDAFELKLIEYGYVAARAALHYSRNMHTGLRKDNVTPAHMHQVRIAFCLLDHRANFERAGINVDRLIAKALLHDIPEDNAKNPDFGFHSMLPVFAGKMEEDEIGEIIDAAFRLSKIRDGRKLSAKEYFEDLLHDRELFIIKLFDRRDNIRTLLSLPVNKMVAYIEETILLLDISMRMHTLYPELDPVTRSVEREIREKLETILEEAAMMRTKKGWQMVKAFRQANLLNRPLPRRGAKPEEAPANDNSSSADKANELASVRSVPARLKRWLKLSA